MARFDLYDFPPGGKRRPMVLDVQADAWQDVLATRLVAPVVRAKSVSNLITGLHVPMDMDGKHFVIDFTELAAVSKSSLGSVRGNLAVDHFVFVGALDQLLQGF